MAMSARKQRQAMGTARKQRSSEGDSSRMSTRKQRQHDGDSSRLHSLFLFVALLAVLFVDDGLGVDALQHTPQTRRNVGERIAATLASLTVIKPRPAVARPEGVNKPELLPSGPVRNVIDVKVNFLTPGEQKRIQKLTEQIEKTSGFKLRVLCQSYPETPGLAIKDYWKVDDKTIVLVADKGLKGTSNILNFNVGDGLADILPTPFWSRLQGRFGTSRYWRDEGEDVAITNAVEAIAYCLQRDSEGDVTGCTDPPSRQMIDAKL